MIFWWFPDFSSSATMRFTFVDLIEMSQQLLDGSPWDLVPIRMNCSMFGDPLTFHLAPLSGQHFNSSSTFIYACKSDGILVTLSWDKCLVESLFQSAIFCPFNLLNSVWNSHISTIFLCQWKAVKSLSKFTFWLHRLTFSFPSDSHMIQQNFSKIFNPQRQYIYCTRSTICHSVCTSSVCWICFILLLNISPLFDVPWQKY